MGYAVLFALLCLTFTALGIYNERGLPDDPAEFAIGVGIGAALSTVFLAGIFAILSAIVGAL